MDARPPHKAVLGETYLCGIELLEEGYVHVCILTVVFIRETPAVCAETDQLPSLLLRARGDHNDWLFLALKL